MTETEDQIIEIWERIDALSLRERIITFYHRSQMPLELRHPIDALDIPTSLYNLLRRAGISTVEELSELTWGQIISLKGVGEGKAKAIRRALEDFKV